MNTTKVRSAIKAGDTKALEEMLKEGLKADAVMKQDWTLLHLAAKAGRANVIKLLLERGAKVDAQTEMRQTALDVALVGDQSEVADLLKKHGGRMGMELSLHSAVLAGSLKWVKKHLNAGANINEQHRGELPLCIALTRHRWDAATLLLKKRPDVNKWQANHNTALHAAAGAGADNTLLKPEKVYRQAGEVRNQAFQQMLKLTIGVKLGDRSQTLASPTMVSTALLWSRSQSVSLPGGRRPPGFPGSS